MKARRVLALCSFVILAAAVQSQCGCWDSRSTANTSTKRTEDGVLRGTVTVPLADGKTAALPVDLSFSRTVAESADTNEHKTSEIDATALGTSIGGAVNAALKQAIPLLSPVLSKPEDGGIGGLLTGGLAAITTVAGGIAALKARQASRAEASADEAWDAHLDQVKRQLHAEQQGRPVATVTMPA